MNPGLMVMHSKDLVNWSEQKYIMVMEKESTAKNCWAPEIFFDKSRKQFIIFWATTIPGRFPDTEKSGDNGYNHRIYYTTTKDFISFSDTRLFYDRGFNVIDATIVQNGKKYMMFLKDETKNPAQKNIRVAVSDSPYGPFSSPSEPITGKYWAEGPTAIKNGKSWIVYFDKYTERRMGAVQSSDLQTWMDISDKITFPRGARHGTVFQADKKTLKLLLKY
jgi:beta-xylosidase